jgi:hypothetical protein
VVHLDDCSFFKFCMFCTNTQFEQLLCVSSFLLFYPLFDLTRFTFTVQAQVTRWFPLCARHICESVQMLVRTSRNTLRSVVMDDSRRLQKYIVAGCVLSN